MDQLGVRSKLLLSVGILAFGYLLFVVMVEWTSSLTRHHLATVSQKTYPAVLSISRAQAGFRQLNKDYETAIVLQDVEGIANADKDRDGVIRELSDAVDRLTYDPAACQDIRTLLETFTRAETLAKSTYEKMLAPPVTVTDETRTSMGTLANDRRQLESMFAVSLDKVGNTAFRSELDAVTRAGRQQRMLAFALALLAFITTLGSLIIMERQVSLPLRDVAHRLSNGAQQVSASAQQVSTSGLSIAEGAAQQAASLEDTSISSEQVSSMARSSAASCRSAAELVELSQSNVGDANCSLDHLVRAMDQISGSSGKIAKIIRTIDEIAFKTNILSLNAAVEAARAGETGKGFAVVAEEVRSLAQKCAQAARDSGEIVDESIRRSTEGKRRLDDVAASMRAVTEDSSKIGELIALINNSSMEQTRGISQIAKSISDIERVTKASAGTSQESAAAAQNLTEQSLLLQEIVTALSTIVGGAGSSLQRHPLPL